MGEPMAARLHGAGIDVVAWNRSAPARLRFLARGGRVADSPAAAAASAETILVMLANAQAIDEVLGRSERGFALDMTGRLLVNVGTVAPSYSRALERALTAAGAQFVEAPVSGSKGPAQAGELVAMLAGNPGPVDRVAELLAPLTSLVVRCGEVPRALETKLAVNIFLITMVTGLAEAYAFGERRGVDPAVLRQALDAGPMASTVSQGKLAKLLGGDMSAQASIRDVRYNSRLILEEVGKVSGAAPLLTLCEQLLAESELQGHGADDMIAIIDAFRARSGAGSQSATDDHET